MGLLLKRIICTAVYMVVAGAAVTLFGLVINLVRGLWSFGFAMSKVVSAMTMNLQIWFYVGAGVMLVASFYNENIWKTKQPLLFGHPLFEKKAAGRVVETPAVLAAKAPVSAPVVENKPVVMQQPQVAIAEKPAGTGYYLSTQHGERLQVKPEDPIGSVCVTHPCPFCGQEASRGRSLNWIASECAKNDVAIFPCNSCERTLAVPSKIFVGTILEELREANYDPRLQQLNERAFSFEIMKVKTCDLLVKNWGEVIYAYNKGLPIEIELMK
jgi:hypothetical protein